MSVFSSRTVRTFGSQRLTTELAQKGLTVQQRVSKRAFDLGVAMFGLLLTWWLILIAFIVAACDTRRSGFFTQWRVGLHGKLFKVIKIRTMSVEDAHTTSVTTAKDARITRLGRFWRATKIDELPQLVNILLGHMSLVGPRPDVQGFADKLRGEDRIILSVRPGITGPASLAFRNEEQILARQLNPEEFNRTVLYPKKILINRRYVLQYSFCKDIKYLLHTILGLGATKL